MRAASLKFTGLRAGTVYKGHVCVKMRPGYEEKLKSLPTNCHLSPSQQHSHSDNVSDSTSLTASNYTNTLRAS